jgi:8-oxo-dGTP pyrophosphatase MutT (NUDIX family)
VSRRRTKSKSVAFVRVPTLDHIRRSLAVRSPVLLPTEGRSRAGVAMVLRDDPAGPSVLFIERAKRDGDPWSGHMAFPGGRVGRGDADSRAAAERETREEVGLALAGAEPIGRLDDRQGNPVTRPSLLISAFVYVLPAAPDLILNHEVEQAFWFPVRSLLEPARHVPYLGRASLEYPGILVGEPGRHVVWGLTYSFLEAFFAVVGRPLPDRWSKELKRAVQERADQDAARSKA